MELAEGFEGVGEAEEGKEGKLRSSKFESPRWGVFVLFRA